MGVPAGCANPSPPFEVASGDWRVADGVRSLAARHTSTRTMGYSGFKITFDSVWCRAAVLARLQAPPLSIKLERLAPG